MPYSSVFELSSLQKTFLVKRRLVILDLQCDVQIQTPVKIYLFSLTSKEYMSRESMPILDFDRKRL